MGEDFVDLADSSRLGPVGIVGGEPAAGRTAGPERPGADGTARSAQAAGAGAPTGEALRAGGQVVQRAAESGETTGERRRIDEV
jgi:hypothetical protein